MDTDTSFVRFGPGVETAEPDEQQQIDRIVAAMRAVSERLGERYRHGVRSVHSKSHGVVTGTLEVLPDLDTPYAQGLFARPGRYPTVVRFSTNPGDLLPDSVTTPRGVALKIVGPEGERMVEGHEGERTQDVLLINGPILGAPGPEQFADQVELFGKHLDDPEQLKVAVSALSRTAEKAFEFFGKPNPTLVSLGGQAPTHILGETFNTQLALRHGDYVAKYALVPVGENLRALTGTELDLRDPDALRDAIVAFFAHEGGVWHLAAQLCTDLETMPVEDGSVPWSEEASPFVPVARLTIEPQPAYTPERRVYADEILSFDPWHALEAHRPLGAHNRARRAAYAMSADVRHRLNARARREPRGEGDFFVVEGEAGTPR